MKLPFTAQGNQYAIVLQDLYKMASSFPHARPESRMHCPFTS